MNKATPYRTCRDCKYFYRVPKEKLRVGYGNNNFKQVCFKHQRGVGVFQDVCDDFVDFKRKNDVQ